MVALYAMMYKKRETCERRVSLSKFEMEKDAYSPKLGSTGAEGDGGNKEILKEGFSSKSAYYSSAKLIRNGNIPDFNCF